MFTNEWYYFKTKKLKSIAWRQIIIIIIIIFLWWNFANLQPKTNGANLPNKFDC